jgi:glycosyltransferase involved in cell wall biosynthesis
MKISVIIPNYNDLRVKRSLNSIYSQTYKNYEVIIVDGLSDNKLVLDVYREHDIDILIHEKDCGIFDALNKGVNQAKGDIIFLMGADDSLSDETVFEKVNKALEYNHHLDGVCIGCEFINASGNVIRKWHPRTVSSKKMRIGIYPPHFSLFLKRELYQLVGRFEYEKTGNIATDTLWLLDLALRKPELKIKVINDVYLKMEYGGASTGSLKRIIKQFIIVHKYAKKKKLPFWFVHSFIKTTSKIFQFIKM